MEGILRWGKVAKEAEVHFLQALFDELSASHWAGFPVHKMCTEVLYMGRNFLLELCLRSRRFGIAPLRSKAYRRGRRKAPLEIPEPGTSTLSFTPNSFAILTPFLMTLALRPSDAVPVRLQRGEPV